MAVDDPDLTCRDVPGAGAGPGLAVPHAESADAAAAAPGRSKPRIAMICRWCGGKAVSRDAWADWDIEAQEWVLGAVFDYAHCHDCDGETSLVVDLATREPTGD